MNKRNKQKILGTIKEVQDSLPVMDGPQGKVGKFRVYYKDKKDGKVKKIELRALNEADAKKLAKVDIGNSEVMSVTALDSVMDDAEMKVHKYIVHYMDRGVVQRQSVRGMSEADARKNVKAAIGNAKIVKVEAADSASITGMDGIKYTLNGKKISEVQAKKILSPQQIKSAKEDLKKDPYLDAGYRTGQGMVSITMDSSSIMDALSDLQKRTWKLHFTNAIKHAEERSNSSAKRTDYSGAKSIDKEIDEMQKALNNAEKGIEPTAQQKALGKKWN